jgi:prefoldin subunit 5
VEVKIGIKDTPRELVVSSNQSTAEVEKLVAEALNAGEGLLRLEDEKGRKYLVPTDRIAYVEIAPSDVRKVGFSVGG